MKDIFESIYEYLTTDETLSPVFGERIFPIVMPDETPYPAIIYQHISTGFYKLLQNQSKYKKVTVQFTVYDTTFGKARNNARLIKQAFLDFKGDMCGTNIESVDIVSESPGKTDTDEYTYILEFEFDYNEILGGN